MAFEMEFDEEENVRFLCDCKDPNPMAEVVFRTKKKEVPRPKKRPKKVKVLMMEVRCKECRDWKEGTLQGQTGDIPKESTLEEVRD